MALNHPGWSADAGRAPRQARPLSREAPAGFLDAFLRRTAQEPDRVLFTIYKTKRPDPVTHAELASGAAHYAAALRAQGACRGEVVLISLPTGRAALSAFLGAALIGCVPSFMPFPTAKQDPSLFWQSHDLLFERIGSSLMVTFAANRDNIERNIRRAELRIVTIEDVGDAAGRAPALAALQADPRHFDDLACLQHSSGTTGLKKGVMLTFGQIAAQTDAYAQAIGLSGADPIASWLPLYHDMGFVACFLMPLALGAPTVLLDPFEWLLDPLFFLELIERHGCRYAWMPNFAFAHLVNAACDDERRADLSGLRALIDCSEPCKPATLRAFADRFASWGLPEHGVQACYALAEAVFAVAQTGIGTPLRVTTVPDHAGLAVAETAVLSCGRPIAGVEVAILDAAGRPLPERKPGQIGLRGDFVFKGYFADPERTGRSFQDGFYLTGDVGFMAAGELHVLGRNDDRIIVLGKNVFAHEIEGIVNAVAGVKPGRAVAFGLYNPEIGSEEVVVVAELATNTADQGMIRTNIRRSLESMLGIVPKAIRLMDPGWLIKSTSGKLSRRENRLKYLAATTSASGDNFVG